jgi:uncharacterized Zn finger protein
LSWNGGWGWRPYVSVARRRSEAQRTIVALKKKGQVVAPVTIEGREIASTFWGRAWCRNLEAYSDFSNRLPRGRTYVRNGSVLDLQVKAGRIEALVMGSDLYTIEVVVDALKPPLWKSITEECAGRIDSLVELLQGRISKGVMEIVTRKGTGLFPSPREIRMTCSCPDWAGLCKHLAAVLYGVGARLDHQPALLFLLRKVDEMELVTRAAIAPLSTGSDAAARARGLDEAALSGIFGIDLEEKPELEREKRSKPKPSPQSRGGAKPVPAKPRAPKRKRPATTTTTELAARGIPSSTVRNWLMERVLIRTSVRGTYRATPETEERIERYLARKRDRRASLPRSASR